MTSDWGFLVGKFARTENEVALFDAALREVREQAVLRAVRQVRRELEEANELLTIRRVVDWYLTKVEDRGVE